MLFKTRQVNTYPAFSPDGRWLAYEDTESGSYEVYVRAYPDKGFKKQISNAGGMTPAWSQNGHDLFYRTEDQRIMVVDYAASGDSFTAGKPRVWCAQQLVKTGTGIALAPDGKRFIVVMPVESPESREMQRHVMLGLSFSDEVRRRLAGQVK